MIGIALSIIYI